MSGTDTAAMVPGRFDVVIDGHGYVFLDSVDPSIPFRTHRAVYGLTQPFVERQNVSNSYGDNAQDFFLTIRQRDWSLGEQQKFFRAGNDGRYWMGQNVDVSTPGQVSLSPTVASLTFAAAVSATSRSVSFIQTAATSATKLYTIDADGTITDKGAHGVGAAPARFGIASEGGRLYMSTSAAGTVGVRKWDGTNFTTFSATAADSIAFVNNTLFGLNYTQGNLLLWDSSGTATSLFQFKAADGTNQLGVSYSKVEPFGGKILMLLGYGQEYGGELWIYDGAGTSRLEVFPSNFFAYDVEVLYGVAFISGCFMRPATASTTYTRPAVLFYDGSQIGLLWQANAFSTATTTSATIDTTSPAPALGTVNGRLVFTDDTIGAVMAYNPATGGVSTIGAYTVSGNPARIGTTATHVTLTRNQTGGYYFPSSTFPSSGYVISSLIDFDSSLSKQFRGIKVEWDAATDGNGGSIDISYQTDSLTGSWTSLQTSAVSGTEYTLTNISGHAIAVKVTINKGTSTAGPTLKSLSVRGAPVMPIYPRGEYILDHTGTESQPRELRDGTTHPLTGYDQVQNLIAARNSATPITVTDKVNGTFTAFIDVNDAQGFDVYEVHPADEDIKKPGAYVSRLTVRGV